MMAYCKGCKANAYLGCLGFTKQKYQLLKLGNDRILLFECDVCLAKKSSEDKANDERFTCIACKRSDGILKSIENSESFVH
jgi:hypothetical protein